MCVAPRQLALIVVLLVGCDDDGADPADASRGFDAAGTDAAGGMDASSPDAPATDGERPEPRDLGTATVLGTCELGDLRNRQACTRVEVRCPDTDVAVAEVRVAHNDSVPRRGTVLMASTGPGKAFIEDEWLLDGETVPCTGRNGAFACELLDGLADDGLLVVQYEWDLDFFVNSTGAGLAANGCRSATLLSHVHDTVHADGAFCAYGNSGGSAQIAYTLTHYGRADLLDYVLLNGGPVTSVIDRMCLDDQDPGWLSTCAERLRGLAATGWSCAEEDFVCAYGHDPGTPSRMDSPYAGTPCTDRDATFRALFQRDSLAGESASTSYPATRVEIALGQLDCTGGAISGLSYADRVPGATVRVIAGGHVSYANPGAPELRAMITGNCTER